MLNCKQQALLSHYFSPFPVCVAHTRGWGVHVYCVGLFGGRVCETFSISVLTFIGSLLDHLPLSEAKSKTIIEL